MWLHDALVMRFLDILQVQSSGPTGTIRKLAHRFTRTHNAAAVRGGGIASLLSIQLNTSLIYNAKLPIANNPGLGWDRSSPPKATMLEDVQQKREKKRAIL